MMQLPPWFSYENTFQIAWLNIVSMYGLIYFLKVVDSFISATMQSSS